MFNPFLQHLQVVSSCHKAFISNGERKKAVTPAFAMLYSIIPSVLEIQHPQILDEWITDSRALVKTATSGDDSVIVIKRT